MAACSLYLPHEGTARGQPRTSWPWRHCHLCLHLSVPGGRAGLSVGKSGFRPILSGLAMNNNQALPGRSLREGSCPAPRSRAQPCTAVSGASFREWDRPAGCLLTSLASWPLLGGASHGGVQHFSPPWLSTFSLPAFPLGKPPTLTLTPWPIRGQELCLGLPGNARTPLSPPHQGPIHQPLTLPCSAGRRGPGQPYPLLPAACTGAVSEPRLAVTLGSPSYKTTSTPDSSTPAYGQSQCRPCSRLWKPPAALLLTSRHLCCPLLALSYQRLITIMLSSTYKFLGFMSSCLPSTVLSPLSSRTRYGSLQSFNTRPGKTLLFALHPASSCSSSLTSCSTESFWIFPLLVVHLPSGFPVFAFIKTRHAWYLLSDYLPLNWNSFRLGTELHLYLRITKTAWFLIDIQ